MKEYQTFPIPPLPTPLTIFSYFKLIPVLVLFNFRKLILRIFLIIIITIRCSGMFQDVPECSVMFRDIRDVPYSRLTCFGRFVAVVSFQLFNLVVATDLTLEKVIKLSRIYTVTTYMYYQTYFPPSSSSIFAK